jgi:hypothetical protein
MIRVAVPTRYTVPTDFRYEDRADGLMWYAATGSPLVTPNSIQKKAYTNLDALYPQIGAEFRYSGGMDESDFTLFPCRKECKQKLGGEKGQAFRECLRECRGKGPKKSALKGMQAESDAELAAALKQISQPTPEDAARMSADSGKKTMYIILGVVVVAIIGISVWLLTKKKA